MTEQSDQQSGGEGLPFPLENTMSRIETYRASVVALVHAVEKLSDELQSVITRDEVADEIDSRLKSIEVTQASLLTGTKNQIRRTRHAAWVLWGFLLALVSFLTIQVHDAHLNECVFSPIESSEKAWVCEAAFPFTDHSSMENIQLGLRYLAGEENPGPVHYHYTVSPQLVGGSFYVLLFGGAAWGVLSYRRRSRQEGDVEGAEVTDEQIAAVTAVHETSTAQVEAHREDLVP